MLFIYSRIYLAWYYFMNVWLLLLSASLWFRSMILSYCKQYFLLDYQFYHVCNWRTIRCVILNDVAKWYGPFVHFYQDLEWWYEFFYKKWIYMEKETNSFGIVVEVEKFNWKLFNEQYAGNPAWTVVEAFFLFPACERAYFTYVL